VVGVGYQALAIETIFPQPVDIPMDWILTGSGPAAPRRGVPDAR
jgi:5-formyltetrahydrofolate cyclo-ligase